MEVKVIVQPVTETAEVRAPVSTGPFDAAPTNGSSFWDEKALKQTIADLEKRIPSREDEPTIHRNRYYYEGVQNTVSDEDHKMREAELEARRLFGEDADGTLSVPLGDMEKLLAESRKTLFRYDGPDYSKLVHPKKKLDVYEGKTVLNGAPFWPTKPLLVPLVGTYDEFRTHFSAFTMGLLEKVLGKLPLVAAGGSVLAALHQWPTAAGLEFPPETFIKECLHKNAWERLNKKVIAHQFDLSSNPTGLMATMSKVGLHKGCLRRICLVNAVQITMGLEGEAAGRHAGMLESFRHSDIDLFLITQDPNHAMRAIVELYGIIRASVPSHVKIPIMRTEHSVTFRLPWPYRNIQVVTRLYRSVQHVLLGFDLDCCCVAYDGRAIISLPRAERALRYRYNLVDVTRQSTSYEARLLKYAKRGFDVAIPGVPMEKVMEEMSTIFKTPDWKKNTKFTGLRLLIALFESLCRDNHVLQKFFRVRNGDYEQYIAKPVLNYIAMANYWRRSVTFAYGHDLAVVLNSNLAAITDHQLKSMIVCRGSVSPTIAFRIKNPHAQDRKDVELFTGSFHPVETPWY